MRSARRAGPARLMPAVLALLAGLSTVVATGAAAMAASCATPPDPAEWAAYKARYVATTGRVVDTGNRRISHSEGQGWGMLLAEVFGDREAFDRIWDWTRTTLQVGDDRLHAWKWVPEADEPLPDRNNASDGDLMIAWALERAARRWDAPSYAEAARPIAAAIRTRLQATVGGRRVLLPGAEGFDRAGGGAVVNLSYYVFPAFTALERLDPSPDWKRIRQDGLDLMDDARFGRWGLPPDWLEILADGRLRPAPEWPARFGYDAVRIPLYLVWGGYGTPERLAPFRAFWRQFRSGQTGPGWASLADGTVAPYPATAGFAAVAQLVDALLTGNIHEATLPGLSEARDYYAASLVMLAKIVACGAAAGDSTISRDS